MLRAGFLPNRRVRRPSAWMILLIAAVTASAPAAADAEDPVAPSANPSPAKLASDPELPLYIPAAAHVSGAAGTDWRSDVQIFNLGPGQAFIEVAMLEKDQANRTPRTRGYVISPGMTHRYRDALHGMFGVSGSAALRIDEADDGLVVTSRTFNQTDSGTYGQFIGALGASRAIGADRPGRIVQLSHFGGTDSGYRTNLGLVNCTDDEISVTVDLFTAGGEALGSRQVSLEPYMFRQIDRIFSTVTGDPVVDGFAIASTATAGGAFFAYGSVVDNRTGDPIYIPASDVSAGPIFIPATAHASGAVGTDWRTDVELHNPGNQEAQVEISLLETGQDNLSPASSIQHVAPGASMRLSDVLESVFSFDGTAALRITPMAGAEVVATSRTYNQTPDGTYGQFVGGIPSSEAIAFGEQGLMTQLTHHRGTGSGFRTNLGFVNCTGMEAEVRIDLYRSNGVLLGSLERTLGPFMHRQENRIFERVTSDDLEDGFAVVSSPNVDARLMAYASVVDNATGDPIYIPATAIVPREPSPTMDPRATMHLLFRSLAVVAENMDVEEMISSLQTAGLQAALLELHNAFPDIVTVGPNSFAVDYGDEYRLHDGNVVSGHLGAYFAEVVIDATTISGLPSFTFDGLAWNHQVPPVDTIFATVDLVVSAEGHVTGTTAFSGTGSTAAKSETVTLDGDAFWDTLLCRHYPVGGSITLTIGNEVYTFTFTPDCDGTFDYSEVTPGWDFTYAFGNPNDDHAQQYIVAVENAETWHYAPVWFWKPVVGGETLPETPPGTVTFRFDFEETVSEAHLRLNMPTFHWAYSRGHNFLYGSADGADWELLMEVPPPEYGMANGGGFDADLPASMVGGNQIWLRAELYSYGDMAPQGGEYTNTAELTRWDQDNPGRTFQLDVRFAEE